MSVTRQFSWVALVALGAAALLLVQAADSARERAERIQRHRNLGKAYYESPEGMEKAAAEFRKILEILPDSVPDRLNLGLCLQRGGQIAEGMRLLEGVQKADPSLPHTWFNLGVAYRKQGRLQEAAVQLEQFIRMAPDDAVGHYNLGLLRNLENQPGLAVAEFREANRLDPNMVGPYFQIYNRLRLLGNRPEEAAKALKAFREAKEREQKSGETEDVEWNAYAELYEDVPARRDGAAQRPVFRARRLGVADGLVLIDADGDRRADVLAWSKDGLRLFAGGRGAAVAPSGLEGAREVRHAGVGDYDNDGLPDLCVIGEQGAVLYRNEKGRFRRVEVLTRSGAYESGLWVDYDHDYDLDLLLLGSDSVLLRNEGAGGFVERAKEFPFAPGKAVGAEVLRTVPDTKGLDIAVAYEGRAGVLYRDRLRGRFEATPLAGLPAGARRLRAWDANGDGWMDLGFRVKGERRLLLNHGGALGEGLSGSGEEEGEAADFNGDGRIDLVRIRDDGTLVVMENRTAGRGGWLSVSLEGVKNPRWAGNSEVEVKTAGTYEKQMYRGIPLVFGLGAYREADTVRITWPNGMIQNEMRQAAGLAMTYKEAPRLSGSCPMIFTWNGRGFQFISDILGVAPLGARTSEGGSFALDHEEHVQIPGEALAQDASGGYEIRVTEELSEVAYIDQLELMAVDHPESIEIFTNDQFQAPPFPALQLFGVRRRWRPVRAVDSTGGDVTDRLLREDRRYPDAFRRNHAGVAEEHTLTMDFGEAAPGNRAVLVLRGWTDWADGSTFFGRSQEPGPGLGLPSLQVKDGRGRWRTVIAEMGIPAGKPKAIVVDLNGKFLSRSREVRIVSKVCVYWDEVFLSEDREPPEVRVTRLRAASAGLRFRGFSEVTVAADRKQPERFDYARVSLEGIWNQTPGFYTRYGDVTPLLRHVDDRMVIMGSGDELQLRYDGRGLPALPAGWRRDFLLKADGWAKDADANTASGDSVEPLPFHGMAGYPYTQRPFAQRSTYQTRQARRLITEIRGESSRRSLPLFSGR
ncbi:MAG: FG-GAP-like repeat-containing protein [Bryobacteraceae bacterium]|nr:FG-GAP-like repeat-containing protein [Bryobacteraceae bacterium]